jgi:hypothetical protein
MKLADYCSTNKHLMSIDGVNTDSTTEGMRLSFAREFTKDWMLQSFKPKYGSEERMDNLAEFIPTRTHMLAKDVGGNSIGPAIVPGQDLWQAYDSYAPDLNHRISNWYFRIEIPSQVKPSATNAVSMAL